jgi:hypothetical protein
MKSMRQPSINKGLFKLLFILIFCSTPFNSTALTDKLIGFEINPSWGYQHLLSSTLSPGLNAGINFQFKLFKKLSLKTGINYFNTSISDERGFCIGVESCPTKRTYSFEIIEIPFNLYLDASSDSLSKTKLFFYAGYSIGEIVNEYSSSEYFNEPDNRFSGPSGFVKTVHFLNLGFDIRRQLFESYYVSIGAGIKQTAMYYRTFGTTRSLQLNLRLSKAI